MLTPGTERFSIDDLFELSEAVTAGWSQTSTADWSVNAGTLAWSCLATADHAVDCVYAPAFMLASARQDDYPVAGCKLTLGQAATPHSLIESLTVATRLLAAIVRDNDPATRAIIFRRPTAIVGAPHDFVPRGALELALHAHDIAVGLNVPFAPSAAMSYRLREHTRNWPMWNGPWGRLGASDDPVARRRVVARCSMMRAIAVSASAGVFTLPDCPRH